MNRTRTPSRRFRPRCELLETRINPVTLPNPFNPSQPITLPDPIDPNNGEANLIELSKKFEEFVNLNALDHLPVPYVVTTSAGGQVGDTVNAHAGAPTRLDADNSKATGQGGKDIKVEVNTELFLPEGGFNPHLVITIDRIGSAPFAQDLQVIVAFPFPGFNSESLPEDPNLFFGFQTIDVGGTVGGHAPQQVEFRLIPGGLGGTDHVFELRMNTTGADNPIQFIAGHFDGTIDTGLVNATGMIVEVETPDGDVPAQITLGIDVEESVLFGSETATSFGLTWDASEAARVKFDYFEDEAPPTPSNPSDFNTTVTYDLMPTHAELGVSLDEDEGTLTLFHRANAVIDAITVLHEREDGLTIVGTLTDVPTEVDLFTDISLDDPSAGSVVLDVNANTLDFELIATQAGGFLDTSDLLGFDLGYLSVSVVDAPDLAAGFNVDVPVINGRLDVDGDGNIDGDDDGLVAGIAVIDGQVDRNGDGNIDGDDDGSILGADVIDGGVDFDDDGDADGDDDGSLTATFAVMARNPGESIGMVEVVGDDDAHFVQVLDGGIDVDMDGAVDAGDDSTFGGFAIIDGKLDVDKDEDVDADDDGFAGGFTVRNGSLDVNNDGLINAADDFSPLLVGLELAPSFEDVPTHHIFSLVEDGTHGTAAGRLVFIKEAVFNFDAEELTDAFHVVTAAAAPFQGYVKFGPDSNILPDDPNLDVEITVDIDVIPAGTMDFRRDGPINFSYEIDPPQGIDSIHIFGHIGSLNFDIEAGDLPPVFGFDFDPDSSMTVVAGDGFGGPDRIGHVALRLWDEENPLPNTEDLFPDPLHDARARVDDIPSFHATWGETLAVDYDGGSGILPGVGEVVLDVTSGATAVVLEPGAAAANGTTKLGRVQGGAFADNHALDVLDRLDFVNQKETFSVGDVVTGQTSGATATVRRVEQVAGRGVLYLSGVAGSFQNDENLRVGSELFARTDGTLDFAPTWAALVNGTPDADGFQVHYDTDADSGPFEFLDGVQVSVSTEVELEDPLPAANPTADDYVTLHDRGGAVPRRLQAGVFGIDEFFFDTSDSLTLHYEANEPHLLNVTLDREFGGAFFPAGADFDLDLNLVIDAIPEEFDFTTDLKTQFVYEASDPITSVTLTGLVDDTDDGIDNGTLITFGLLGLPSQVRVGIIPDEVAIINGELDVNASGGVNGDDDGMLAGVRVIDGRLDLNGDTVVNGADDGTFFAIAAIDGRLDVVPNGVIDGADDGAVAGAEVFANAGVNVVGLSLESENNGFGIFGEDYRVVRALVTDIPAQFVLSYGANGFFLGDVLPRFLVETRDALGNPQPLGELTALVATTNDDVQIAEKIEPFTLLGPVQGGSILGDTGITGPGGPGGSRINYSAFLQEIDKRYYNEGENILNPSSVLARLADLYAGGERYDVADHEDHVIVRNEGGKVDVASVQFNGFQHVSWIPDPDGGQLMFRAPGPGDHPLFIGFEDGDFTTVQIENVPDEIVVDIDKTEHLNYDASSSPGEIDLYIGPAVNDVGLFASDTATATRAIMNFTPSFVHINWDFGFPDGFANFDASNEFEILFLTQDGSNRITAGLQMEDLQLGYDIDILTFEVTDDITIPIPFVDDIVIPTAWELFEATAGIDNDASDSEIQGNPAKPGVDGLFSLYTFKTSDLLPVNSGPSPSGDGEFVPFLSIMEEGFREFSLQFLVELDPLNTGADIWPIDLELNVTLSGNLIFDIWSPANTDFTDDDAIPFIPEVGFINPPDYTDNTPFHILPGLFEDPIGNGLKGIHNPFAWVITFDGWHSFDEHFDPFAGTPPPFGGSSGTGGSFLPGDLNFLISTLGPFGAALSRWADAGLDEATIQDLSDTTIELADLPGNVLGEVTVDGKIRIDPDAGGFEWFIDPTPFDDAEYTGGGPPPADLTADPGGIADGKVDMVTFFAHEIGHILELGHTTLGVMQDTLPRGVRRVPVAADLSADPPGDPAPDGPDEGALKVAVVTFPAPAEAVAAGPQLENVEVQADPGTQGDRPVAVTSVEGAIAAVQQFTAGQLLNPARRGRILDDEAAHLAPSPAAVVNLSAAGPVASPSTARAPSQRPLLSNGESIDRFTTFADNGSWERRDSSTTTSGPGDAESAWMRQRACDACFAEDARIAADTTDLPLLSADSEVDWSTAAPPATGSVLVLFLAGSWEAYASGQDQRNRKRFLT